MHVTSEFSFKAAFRLVLVPAGALDRVSPNRYVLKEGATRKGESNVGGVL
jgi:hypothetical protein